MASQAFLEANPEWLERMGHKDADSLFEALDTDHSGALERCDKFNHASLTVLTFSRGHRAEFKMVKISQPVGAVEGDTLHYTKTKPKDELDGKTHMVFGYGSLLNSESRKGTGKAGEFVYAVAKGFERGWTYHAKHACKFDGGCFNGVVKGTSDSSLGGLCFQAKT